MKRTILIALILLAGTVAAQTPEERIAAVKQSLGASMEALKGFEWTETTIVNYGGEEKSHTLATCSYGPDGKVVKEPMGEAPHHERKRGLRGRRAEAKMAELKEYMASVSGLVHTYVPPDPAKIQACKDAGKLDIEVVEVGKTAVLRLADYNMAGDSVGIEVDLTLNEIVSYEVNSDLGSGSDPVKLHVSFEKLEDGTIYPGLVEIDAPAETISVDISNTDYRHAAK